MLRNFSKNTLLINYALIILFMTGLSMVEFDGPVDQPISPATERYRWTPSLIQEHARYCIENYSGDASDPVTHCIRWVQSYAKWYYVPEIERAHQSAQRFETIQDIFLACNPDLKKKHFRHCLATNSEPYKGAPAAQTRLMVKLLKRVLSQN